MTKVDKNTSETIAEEKKLSPNRLNVSPKLIDKMIKERTLRSLAVFCILKRKFTNSVLYNYKSRMPEFAALAGCSTKTLYKHFSTLRRYGLISEVKSSIVMVSTRKIKDRLNDRKIARITIYETDTLENVLTELRGKALYDHRDRTLRAVQIEQFEIKHSGRRREYPCKLSSGEFRETSQIAFRPSISIMNLARVFNVSKPTAIRIKRDLNDRGIIASKPSVHRLAPCYLGSASLPPQRYAEDTPGYIYKHENGFVYYAYGDTHSFVEYPNYLTELTTKQYFAIKKSQKNRNVTNA